MASEPMIINVTITGTGSSFTLRYGSVESNDLTTSHSASQFDSTVTAIIDGATGSNIRITKSASGNQTTFQVVFFEAVLRNATLQVGRYNSSLIDVTITTIQMGRLPDNLILSFPSRNTGEISLPSEQSVLVNQLLSIISVSCTKSSTSGEIYWTHTYENTRGRLWGTRDNSIDPMCGRYSLKNPTYVFKASESIDDITQQTVGNIPWETYNWVNHLAIYICIYTRYIHCTSQRLDAPGF